MDVGPEYRNVVGWPGGMSSPLWPIFETANTFGMELRAGAGNDGDTLNVVWVMDSDAYPFYPGEQFHQFHSNFFNSPGMPVPRPRPERGTRRSAPSSLDVRSACAVERRVWAVPVVIHRRAVASAEGGRHHRPNRLPRGAALAVTALAVSSAERCS